MSINIDNYDKEKLLKAYNQIYGEKRIPYTVIDVLSSFNPALLVGGIPGIVITGILSPIISRAVKSFDELLTDFFYAKQIVNSWNEDRISIYKSVVRQVELFGLNAKISNMDIDSYIKQWIEQNPKYAMQFDAMIETAISYSQSMLDDATSGDVIDFYKKQVLSLMNWKEKYDRADSNMQKSTGPSTTPKMKVSQKKNQKKTDNKKTSASPEVVQTSIGIESISVELPKNIDSTGYSGSGFSLGDFGKIDLEIGTEINLEKDDLTPALDNVISKTEKIINDVPVEKVTTFGENLLTASKYIREIGSAFMNVDESIGKAIGSAGGLAASISKIYSAVSADPLEGIDTTWMTPEQIEEAKKKGEKQNGLAIMAGIQGAFAGLQGLFGGEAGSDTSQLLGGMGGVGAGIAGLLTGNPLEGITSLISGLPSLFDGLFESTQEGLVKMLSRQGFNDTYSEDLIDKIAEVSDRMGDSSYGISANIEQFFKETNIDNEEEFSRMSDLLSGSIGEYIAQGHSNDEAYEKFGDELEQLVAAQEKYGFETTASLRDMIEIQKTQTREGRIEGMKSALGGFEKIISGIEKQMKLSPDFKLSGTSISGIAGSLTNTYYELINQGMAASEAVDAVKPLLSKYAGMAEEQGWDLSQVPGYSQLSSYFDSLDKASGALDMIQGSAEVVEALSGSGMMDQATLTSQGSLGLDVMHQLEASGLNETQVLQQMGGWLQQMQEASGKWGLSLSPEIQALIAKAEEKGVMPEEQKPVDEVIADGIETGFTRAIEVVDKYFGGLAEFGEGGTVPGAVGQKKLILAHAGEFVGFPEQLTALASNPAFASGNADLAAFLQAMVQNMGLMASSMSVSEVSQMHMGEPSGMEYAQILESKARENDRKLAEELQAQRAAQAESNQLQLAQTIENNIKLKVSGRDFVSAIKQDIYEQIKEDSRRGMITIHDSAIRKY